MAGLFTSSDLQELPGLTGSGSSAFPMPNIVPAGTPQKDIFAEKQRAGWHKPDDKALEARCDLSVERMTLTPHASIPVLSIWKKSIKGRTLTDIKGDDSMVIYFANHLVPVIKKVLGNYLGAPAASCKSCGGERRSCCNFKPAGGELPRCMQAPTWAIVPSPKRRHLTQNFACRIAAEIGSRLGIPYYEDVALAHTRQRVNVEFDLGTLPPEPNLIIFDDFVTTGSTLSAMYRLLEPLGKNLFFVVGINNNL